MHRYFLQQALDIARFRQGFCAPNPSVGAIVVKNSEIIGQGYHNGVGTAHAEVNAITSASSNIQGANIYVTLEPCCHHGRTPPCTDALIKAGVAAVYYGLKDPNPVVAGKGEAALKAAGIECQQIEVSDIDEFYRSYVYWHQHQLPWVTLKLAMSMDGKIAGPNGQPISITGPDLKQFTHSGRKRADAILTTVKTISNDDPQLNVRLNGNIIPKPLYILDKHLQLPNTARVYRTMGKITLFHEKGVKEQRVEELLKRNIECIAVSADNTGLNLTEVLKHIGQQGMHELWVEAGGKCFQSFVNHGLAQQAYVYMAPTWLGSEMQSAFDSKLNLIQGGARLQWHNIGRDGVCEINWPLNTNKGIK